MGLIPAFCGDEETVPVEITFVLQGFEGNTDDEDAYSLKLALWHLVHEDEMYLRRHPQTPSLYDAHDRGWVWYQEEPPGEEKWLDIPSILKQGWCDCEEIAAWRVAELRVRHGLMAEPHFDPPKKLPDGGNLYHIQVKYPPHPRTGISLIEDPCRKLGMR